MTATIDPFPQSSQAVITDKGFATTWRNYFQSLDRVVRSAMGVGSGAAAANPGGVVNPALGASTPSAVQSNDGRTPLRYVTATGTNQSTAAPVEDAKVIWVNGIDGNASPGIVLPIIPVGDMITVFNNTDQAGTSHIIVYPPGQGLMDEAGRGNGWDVTQGHSQIFISALDDGSYVTYSN